MNDDIEQLLLETGYINNNETLQLKYKKYRFGFNKTYTFFIYKHKDCIRNVSELESATIDPEREEIIRVKNERGKSKNLMKEFLDQYNYGQRHTASALERANDVHTEEIESVQTGGGGL